MYFNFNYDNEDLHRQLIVKLYNYFIDMGRFDIYVYDFLENNLIIDKKVIQNSESMTKEQLETVMKTWVESQRGE